MENQENSHKSNHAANGDASIERLEKGTVLIAGGGPVGLMLGTVLAHYGVKSIILERNESTTKWPKMDLTNVRSMELLRRLGFAEEVRKLGVPTTTPYNVYITPGLHTSKAITAWEFPCVEDLRAHIRDQNDGSMPSEPWQRISQAIFERYLKTRCDENPLVDCRFGWKVEKSVESENGVLVEAVQAQSGKKATFFTQYLAACDGASSRTRRDMEIPLDGGPVPGYVLLVHFKSRDLDKLFKQGRFWHLFISNENGLGGAVISQDDEYIFTTHLLLPLEADHSQIDSHDAVYRVLGGMGGPFKIDIDEILIRSTYRHSIAVARQYRSRLGHVFLAGDAAHQNIPTGGYGMNTGIGDAFDLGWKLAAVINGHGGSALFDSYEQERRAVALTSIQHSGIHMETHFALSRFLGPNPHAVVEDSDEGRAIRKRIHDHYQANKGENTDLGIEMDHRHKSCVYPLPNDVDGQEPEWNPARYVPSTFVGSRAPHVYLKDGSSIFDHFGKYWTLIEFSDRQDDKREVTTLLDAANAIDMPVKHVVLCDEENARKIWHSPLVLVRPDGHVAWRGGKLPDVESVEEIVKIVSGRKAGPWGETNTDEQAQGLGPFAATEGMGSQVDGYKLEKMGVMQS